MGSCILNFENTPMGTNMEYITMHSKTKVKLCSEEDARGQLLYSLLDIREQYREMWYEIIWYEMYVRHNSSLYYK